MRLLGLEAIYRKPRTSVANLPDVAAIGYSGAARTVSIVVTN